MSPAEPSTKRPGLSPVTAVILAGGLGRRMGNVDKGLTLLEGRPLVAWVLQRIAPQVEEVLINANRNSEKYSSFGYRVIADRIRGLPGRWRECTAGCRNANTN